jgi:WD40 repeat protein
VATGRVAVRLKEEPRRAVWSVAFSPDGKLWATGSLDGSVRLWDAATGREVRALDDPGEDVPLYGLVFGVTFSPDGRRILAYGNGRNRPSETDRDNMRIWDVASGKRIASLEGHQGAVCFAAFLADGKRVLSQDSRGVVHLWDVERGKAVRTYRNSDARVQALAPDGKLALSYDWRKLWLWDVDTGKEVRVLAEEKGGIERAVFSPDGKKVLWRRKEDDWLRVSEVTTGKVVQDVPPRRVREGAWAVAFAPDGRLVRCEGTGRRRKLTLHKLDEVATVPGGASPRPLGEQKGR